MRTVFLLLVSCKMTYGEIFFFFAVLLSTTFLRTKCSLLVRALSPAYLCRSTMAKVSSAGDLKCMWFSGHLASQPCHSCGHTLALNVFFVWVKSQDDGQSGDCSVSSECVKRVFQVWCWTLRQFAALLALKDSYEKITITVVQIYIEMRWALAVYVSDASFQTSLTCLQRIDQTEETPQSLLTHPRTRGPHQMHHRAFQMCLSDWLINWQNSPLVFLQCMMSFFETQDCLSWDWTPELSSLPSSTDHRISAIWTLCWLVGIWSSALRNAGRPGDTSTHTHTHTIELLM